MNELLKQIGIDAEPVKGENGSYNIDIEDSNEYGKYFSKLDKDKYEVLYTYCCCSEIGCRKCSAYKYLKEKSQE